MTDYQYKASGMEWLGQIPNHWSIDRIKDKTIDVTGGDWGDDPDSNEEGNLIVVLRVADIDGLYFHDDNLTNRRISDTSLKSRQIDERSLIIEKSGGGEKQYVGRVGYPKNIREIAICSNFMAKLQFDRTVDIRFMNYLFCALYNADLNYPHIQQTTGIQNLNVEHYLQTKVSFPPLPEQKAIAEYLDTACQKIDRVIAKKEQQIEKINSYLRSRVLEIVKGDSFKDSSLDVTGNKIIGNIPANWSVKRLKRVLSKINSGVTPKGGATSYVENGIPLIRSQNVTFDGLKMEDVVFIDEETHESMSNSKVQNGDVLLNITGASMGRCFYVEKIDEANVNQHVCILRPRYRIITKYLYFLLYSEIGQYQIFSGYTGSGREGLNFQAIKNFKVPLPDIETQKNIITQLDTLFEKVREQKRVISDQLKILKKYKKSLIHECVTGKKQVFEETIGRSKSEQVA